MNGAIMFTHIYLFDFKVFFYGFASGFFLCWMCGLYTNLGVTILSFVVRKDQHLGRECMVNKANKEKDVKYSSGAFELDVAKLGGSHV